MILQLLQDECRATRIVPDRGGSYLLWSHSLLTILLFVPHPCPSSSFLHSPFPVLFPLCVSLFSFHLALLSSDTLNQGVIDNVSASLSTSVNSLTLVCFSSPPPFCNVSSSARGHFVTPIPPLHYRQNVYTRYTPDVLIPEKMKSQDNPCKTSFFFSPSSLRYLRLYTQHRSKDSFLSAHCVRAFFLCHSWTLHLPENMQWRHGNHQNSQTENHIFVPFLISGYMYMKTWV